MVRKLARFRGSVAVVGGRPHGQHRAVRRRATQAWATVATAVVAADGTLPGALACRRRRPVPRPCRARDVRRGGRGQRLARAGDHRAPARDGDLVRARLLRPPDRVRRPHDPLAARRRAQEPSRAARRSPSSTRAAASRCRWSTAARSGAAPAWDLTAATAGALGFKFTDRLGAVRLRVGEALRVDAIRRSRIGVVPDDDPRPCPRDRRHGLRRLRARPRAAPARARACARSSAIRRAPRSPTRSTSTPATRSAARGLAEALDGCSTAYYLIHSMGRGGTDDFAARDREAAANFGEAARAAGVGRVIYLGGLGDARTPSTCARAWRWPSCCASASRSSSTCAPR